MTESPCCEAPFVSFRSLNMKMCADCLQEFPWDLKKGQNPLLTGSRDNSKFGEHND